MLGPFYTSHSVLLTLALDRVVFYGYVTLSSKTWYSSFVKKFFVFQKTCFRVKALKMFKISSDCLIKICWSLKRRGVLKISSAVFRGNSLRSGVYQRQEKKQLIFCRKGSIQSNSPFPVCLMNCITNTFKYLHS